MIVLINELICFGEAALSQPYLGEIRIFPWNWPPKGWALCNGALLPVNQNAALFALLGTTYGGNGTTTFALPDLQGRVPIHRSSTFPQGAMFGQEAVTLLQTNLPLHNHALLGTTTVGDRKNSTNSALAASSTATNYYYSPPTTGLTSLNPASIAMVGGNQPHNNMQPFLVLNYCIAKVGIFPSRN